MATIKTAAILRFFSMKSTSPRKSERGDADALQRLVHLIRLVGDERPILISPTPATIGTERAHMDEVGEHDAAPRRSKKSARRVFFGAEMAGGA